MDAICLPQCYYPNVDILARKLFQGDVIFPLHIKFFLLLRLLKMQERIKKGKMHGNRI